MDATPSTTQATSPDDDVLASLLAERGELAVRRTQAEQDVSKCDEQIAALTQRMSAI